MECCWSAIGQHNAFFTYKTTLIKSPWRRPSWFVLSFVFFVGSFLCVCVFVFCFSYFYLFSILFSINPWYLQTFLIDSVYSIDRPSTCQLFTNIMYCLFTWSCNDIIFTTIGTYQPQPHPHPKSQENNTVRCINFWLSQINPVINKYTNRPKLSFSLCAYNLSDRDTCWYCGTDHIPTSHLRRWAIWLLRVWR